MEDMKRKLLAFHCPRWKELPDVELYIDQVVNYVEKHTELLDVSDEGKLITPSMINNYVKMKLIPPPVKRRYRPGHLARLIVICLLKRDFSIAELNDMTQLTLKRFDRHDAYDFFCDELERSLARVFHEELPPPDPQLAETQEYQTIQAVMTAFANKVYAKCVLKAYLDRQPM